MEYNPMEEMGFTHDKQFVCGDLGFISANNNARRMCARLIRNGGHVFDVISRYDDIMTYYLRRENDHFGSTMKMILPFLNAFGATDHWAYEFSKEDLEIFPGADRAMRYAWSLLPAYINTCSYEHHMMAVCDAIGFPISNVSCTQASFDSVSISKAEARELKNVAGAISEIKLPDNLFSENDGALLEDEDVSVIEVLDSFFLERLPEMDLAESLKPVEVMGQNEKTYVLLEVRRRTDIEFSDTVYIGGDSTDGQAMDLVRDNSGLSVSFNGDERAVRSSNIAVIGNDATAVAVLTSEFYVEGIEAVFDLVDNWDRKTLADYPCADVYLRDAMLNANPGELPAVHKVDRRNANDIAKESAAFRRKILR
jgi:energy-converting hydrogenase A subunit R